MLNTQRTIIVEYGAEDVSVIHAEDSELIGGIPFVGHEEFGLTVQLECPREVSCSVRGRRCGRVGGSGGATTSASGVILRSPSGRPSIFIIIKLPVSSQITKLNEAFLDK